MPTISENELEEVNFGNIPAQMPKIADNELQESILGISRSDA